MLPGQEYDITLAGLTSQHSNQSSLNVQLSFRMVVENAVAGIIVWASPHVKAH